MEMVKRAIGRARSQREGGPPPAGGTPPPGVGPLGPAPLRLRRSDAMEAAWDALPMLELDARRLRRNRVVTLEKRDPAHMAYDMLRTKVLHTLKSDGMRTVAMTSCDPDCGKTLTTLNLAFSFARQPNWRTLVLDLDLRRPRLRRLLGAPRGVCVSELLAGRAAPGEVLRRAGETLAFAFASGPVGGSSELLQDERAGEALASLVSAYGPDLILVDLPPLMASDDASAFLGRADGAFLVAAAGQTKVTDIDEGCRQIGRLTRDLGVVLNKIELMPKRYYDYAYR